MDAPSPPCSGRGSRSGFLTAIRPSFSSPSEARLAPGEEGDVEQAPAQALPVAAQFSARKRRELSIAAAAQVEVALAASRLRATVHRAQGASPSTPLERASEPRREAPRLILRPQLDTPSSTASAGLQGGF